LITDLPGQPEVNFTQYSGYIEVDPAHGRRLFYWFVESQRSPQDDKLVLWLNGGPGCSSLAGLLTEHGPFRVNPDGETLSENPNSWNRVANVIYLESPAGVGFSYSEDKEDYNVGDLRTANDSYTFLQGFMSEFPEYVGRQLWITGESYGGHYVPELAARIIAGNDDLLDGYVHLNIEGFMAGNPWTFMPIDNYGAVFYWWTHALISDFTFYGINSTCNYTDNGPFQESQQSACNYYMNNATQEMGNINIYDMYVDVCTSSRSKKIVHQLAKAGSIAHQVMDNIENAESQIDPPYQPCSDELTGVYLNLPDVQAALHVDSKNFTWYECSPILNYNYSDVEKSVLPLYDQFLKEDITILVYSGDVDAIVPYGGTRQWVANLNRAVLSPWKPYIVDQQVGGYYTVYEGFTFATVRNAGHMVPETQPERAYHMFSNFLYGTPF